ncbi:hypothetical protein BJ138DRAFT_1161597, partial [Hygrophoropsis aurantiaca]
MLDLYRSRKVEKQAQKAAELEKYMNEMNETSLALFGKLPPPPGALGDTEHIWCIHYEWLQASGYLLRPRYAPGWTPSWEGTSKFWFECEDGQIPVVCVG